MIFLQKLLCRLRDHRNGKRIILDNDVMIVDCIKCGTIICDMVRMGDMVAWAKAKKMEFNEVVITESEQ